MSITTTYMNIKYIKIITLMAIMYLMAISVFCMPAKRVWRIVTLADGTTIEVMTVGDEHGHWLVDRKGKALRIENGEIEYIANEQMSNIKALRTERIVKSNARRMERIKRTRVLSKNAKKAKQEVLNAKTSSARKTSEKTTSFIGQKRGLVILVNYSDLSFKKTNTLELFNRRFNEVGYSDNGYIGSVHDYFLDQSYGLFDLEFDVVGPVTVSKPYSYYGANDKDGNDKHAASMVIEAIKLADDNGIDFSIYDWDGDGEVDQVFVIYCGTGEAASYKENDIWPHEWSLSEARQYNDGTGALTLDGVKIDTYAVSCELANSSTIDGIGCACHEFSHCLGYADLYDIDYSGGQGMMYWDLLDGGSYNGPDNNGEIPAAYTSFERWWAGWLEPEILDSPQTITNMPAINDTAVAYKIINDAHPDEYYLLENRQAKKWDLYTGGKGDGSVHGMMILHVDYNEKEWTENAPNDDPNHQRMTFFPASNSYGTKTKRSGEYYWSASFSQCQGHPFPGTKENTSFTDSTKPAATLYNKNTDGRYFMGKPITDIKEENGLISFSFMMATDINAIISNENPTSKHIYNINGQYAGTDISALKPGIYIIGTRKFIKR